MAAAPRRRYAPANKECRDGKPQASALRDKRFPLSVTASRFTCPPCPGICGAHSGPGPMTPAAARPRPKGSGPPAARPALARRIKCTSVPSAGCGFRPKPPLIRRPAADRVATRHVAGPTHFSSQPLGLRPQAWGQPVGRAGNRLRPFRSSHGSRLSVVSALRTSFS